MNEDKLKEELSDKINIAIEKRVNHFKSSPETKEAITNLTMELKYIKKDVKDIKDKIDNLPTTDQMNLSNRELVEEIFEKVKKEYVSKTEFDPVRKAVYWTVGIGGTAVVSAIIYSVIK